MKQNILETIVGFAVIFIAIFFLTYSYSAQNSDYKERYKLHATFQSVEGIIKGGDVSIGGIIVGTIENLTLDPVTYDAKVELAIDKDIKIPLDSRASIASSGFLGGKYVAITPGGDEEYLKPGDRLKYTQSSINLESLIGKFMYSGGGSKGSSEKPDDQSQNQTP
jgi:phospholipid/cholesterol/gamma-HCH transport system substrate-binding protein